MKQQTLEIITRLENLNYTITYEGKDPSFLFCMSDMKVSRIELSHLGYKIPIIPLIENIHESMLLVEKSKTL